MRCWGRTRSRIRCLVFARARSRLLADARTRRTLGERRRRRSRSCFVGNFLCTGNFNGLTRELVHLLIKGLHEMGHVKRLIQHIEPACCLVAGGFHGKQGGFIRTSVTANNTEPLRFEGTIFGLVPSFQDGFPHDTIIGTIASSRQFVVRIAKDDLHGKLFFLELFFVETFKGHGHFTFLGLATSHGITNFMLLVRSVLVHDKVNEKSGRHRCNGGHRQNQEARFHGATSAGCLGGCDIVIELVAHEIVVVIVIIDNIVIIIIVVFSCQSSFSFRNNGSFVLVDLIFIRHDEKVSRSLTRTNNANESVLATS